jgi:two-component system chemotaxis response regulator CheB
VILKELPKDFGVPILIVQHITTGFLPGLVEWLTETTGFPVCIAKTGDRLQAPMAYFAPDDFHLEVTRDGMVILSDRPHENGLRPSVAHLFRSVTAQFGAAAVGVLLTGMGKDGAQELKLLKDCGAMTIAQDKESSVIYGMPGEAVKLDAATVVLPPIRIAEFLQSLVYETNSSRVT